MSQSVQPLQTPGLNKVLQNACLDLDPNCLNDNVDGISERISFGKINFEKKDDKLHENSPSMQRV